MNIVRSHRKTIALIIERDGSLTVRAPLRASRAEIERLLAEKAAWIAEKQALARTHQPPVHHYVPGERFWFLGVAYPLEITAGAAPALSLRDGRFYLAQAALPKADRVFEGWYRAQARTVITARSASLAARFGYTYTSLRIGGARGRWGSCGPKGSLNFTWRLVQAPPEAIDYVIIHELAHLAVRSHAPEFWARVRQHLPDYERPRRWLRDFGLKMADL